MRKIFFIILLIISVSLLYARYVEPKELITKEYSINNSKITNGFDGFKIVHFSDLLYRDDEEFELLKDTIGKINNQDPDIIVFTGDVIKENINQKKLDKIKQQLNKLNDNTYKFAIRGDNDNEKVTDMLQEANFTIIDNSYSLIFNEDNTPILIGNGNYEIKEDLEISYKIALIHKPDKYDDIKNDYDLVLAGHSLGGQIRLPLWGALIIKEGAKKYKDDEYNDKLYVNFGLGTEETRFRLLNKPSINIYRLYAK